MSTVCPRAQPQSLLGNRPRRAASLTGARPLTRGGAKGTRTPNPLLAKSPKRSARGRLSTALGVVGYVITPIRCLTAVHIWYVDGAELISLRTGRRWTGGASGRSNVCRHIAVLIHRRTVVQQREHQARRDSWRAQTCWTSATSVSNAPPVLTTGLRALWRLCTVRKLTRDEGAGVDFDQGPISKHLALQAQQYRIPDFQRSYSWTPTEWRTLWVDILRQYRKSSLAGNLPLRRRHRGPNGSHEACPDSRSGRHCHRTQ